MQRKKALLDMHTNLASALLQQIKARALDNYSSLEESCIQRGMVDRKELLEAIGNSSSPCIFVRGSMIKASCTDVICV